MGKRISTPLEVWTVTSDGSIEGNAPAPLLAPLVVAIAERAVRTERQATEDVEISSLDEGSRALRLTATPMRSGTVIVVALGLGAVREAEETLSRYELVLRATNDAVWDWNVAAQRAWWNPRQYELLGYDPRTTVPSYEAWIRRIHPDDRERVVRHFDEAVSSGAIAWQDEFRFLRDENGAAVGIAMDRGYIERDADGKPLRMIGVMTEVTEQRSTTAALKASQELFLQLTSAIDEVFWLTNREGNEIVYVSPAYATVWGRPTETLYRKPDSFLDWIHEDDRERIRAKVPLLHEGGYDEIYRIRRPDGAVAWLRDRAFPIRDASGAVIRIAGVATDITALRALEERLAQAQRLESIGRLAGGIAHDFNNLLTVISASVDLALLELETPSSDDPPGASTELAHIREAADRAANLTAQLLAFARRQVVAPRRLDLNELTRKAESLLRRVIGEHVELTTVLDPRLHPVMADRGQLEQVLVNLAINARDAMPNGGRLTIETHNLARRRDDAIAYPQRSTGDYVVLAVSDTGEGMDSDVLPYIFEPFFTTKPAGQGTGLGLATCYGIVQQAGGELSVRSEPGRGTTFEIILPRLAADTAATEPDTRSTIAAAGTETVLLVEDDASVRHVGLRILNEHGYRVLSARDAADALRVAAEHDGPIHLLLTDVVMPHMSGTELARRMTAQRPETRILYTSGYSAEAIDHTDAFEPRAAFLPKPYALESLLAKVREVLDRR